MLQLRQLEALSDEERRNEMQQLVDEVRSQLVGCLVGWLAAWLAIIWMGALHMGYGMPYLVSGLAPHACMPGMLSA